MRKDIELLRITGVMKRRIYKVDNQHHELESLNGVIHNRGGGSGELIK